MTPARVAKRLWRHPDLLTLAVAVWLACACNLSFWHKVLAAEPQAGLGQIGFLAALWFVLVASNGLLLSVFGWRWLQKPFLVLVVVCAAFAAYFMDNYGAVIDRHALQSVLETDAREGSAWLSWRMAAYALLLGLLPAIAIVRWPVEYRPWPRELLARVLFMLACLAVMVLATLPVSRNMASLARNHRELRHLATPFNLFNAIRGHLQYAGIAGPVEITPLGTDAHPGRRHALEHKPLLLVIVVGESARASSFSLNGYARDTNPELAAVAPLSFTQVESCGTNTATSLPCMFSRLGRSQYSEVKAKSSENLLDVLGHGGYSIRWLDNNTGSKGIADRFMEVDLAGEKMPGLCNGEYCLDQILVERLRTDLAATGADASTGNEVVVLHMIGSHGPAYYERYPPEYERFKPTCRSNTLQDCSQQDIINTYDNTIAYTDHVLAQLIGLLGEQSGQRTTALLYVSDHGESTGEHGLYLHGAPFIVAPSEQTHVPMLLWTSPSFTQWRGLDTGCLAARRGQPISHDHLFHSVLGLLDLETGVHEKGLDVFLAA